MHRRFVVSVVACMSLGVLLSGSALATDVYTYDQAPDWPFAGWLVYSDSPRSVQYLDTRSGDVAEVSVGVSERLSFSCMPELSFEQDHVELWFSDVASAVIHIPWGDFAYPLFAAAADHTVRRQPSLPTNSLAGIFRIEDTHRLVAANGERFQIYEELGFEQPGLLRPIGRERSLDRLVNDLVELDPDDGLPRLVDISMGSDGRHYGLRFVYEEPACPSERIYVVDGVSGDTVLCAFAWGGGLGGPILVSDTELSAAMIEFAFPSEVDNLNCELDVDLHLWALSYGY